MDWNSVVLVALGGAISYVGMWLQSLQAGRSERRNRTATAALAVRAALLDIEMMETRWHDIDGHGRVSIRPETTAAVQTMRSEVMLIPDRDVRTRLDEVAALLGDSDSIQAFHHDFEFLVRQRLCTWGREAIGAYLRGDKQPDEPPFLPEYRTAVAEADEAAREAHEALNE
jgi:hypothetical protein